MNDYLEYVEVNPLPAVCIGCIEPDCLECDFALDRYQLTPDSQIRLDNLKAQYRKRREK